MMLTKDDIIGALRNVADPGTGRNVVEAGMISGVAAREGGRAGFLITIARDEQKHGEVLRKACERAVAALPGVTSVTAVLTAESKGDDSIIRTPFASAGVPPAKKAVWNKEPLAHVKRLIAVASGKGGVGKSTTAVNLAHALAAAGERVGLLDADIYGPSIPRMLGLKGKPEVNGNLIIPLKNQGILAMSMGLLVGEESALVWRGPQASKALNQLLRGVEWGTEEAPLDTLIIDMPPGTGDVQLSLAQQAPIMGVIIVTTPQEVAVADARKAADMFRKVGVPLLGVIENMSGFADPSGKVHAIFGEGGGRKLANEQSVPFLGQVPLVMALREASDSGAKFEDATGIFKGIASAL